MDGTLLDTEMGWFPVLREVAARFGAHFTQEQYVRTRGQSLEDNARHLAALTGSDPLAMEQLLGALAEDHYRTTARAMPGALELFRALLGRIPMAAATNTPGRLAGPALASAGFVGFDAVVSGADLGRPKPDPAVYLEACRLLGVRPADVIAFEDTPTGVASATAAGLEVVHMAMEGSGTPLGAAALRMRSLSDVSVTYTHNRLTV